MSSRIVKEDDEFLHMVRYLHDDPDELADWMIDKDGNYTYPENIIMADDGAAYELRLDYRIRKSDGHVFYDGIS